MNFSPDSLMRSILDQSSHMFHVVVGLDPLGNFSAVENLAYDNEAFEYAELGRNHAPVRLPWNPVGKPGDITLRWGMVVRAKLYSWMNDVEVGKDYRKSLYIIQLSRKRIPLRIYHLTGCFPLGWRAADFNVEQSAAVGTEELRIAYDQVDLLNLALISAAVGGIMDLLRDTSGSSLGDIDLRPTPGEAYSSELAPIIPPGFEWTKMDQEREGEDVDTAYEQDIQEGEDLAPDENEVGRELEDGEEVGAFERESEGAYEQNVPSGEDLGPDQNEQGASEATEGEGGDKGGPGEMAAYEAAPSSEFEIHDMSIYETIWGTSGLSEEDLAAREAEWEAIKAAWVERMNGG